MLVYNNNPVFGHCGPFQVVSFAALADEMQPSFEMWRDETEEIGLYDEDDLPGWRTRIFAELRRQFLQGLSVVCPDCGNHGEQGDERFKCGCGG